MTANYKKWQMIANDKWHQVTINDDDDDDDDDNDNDNDDDNDNGNDDDNDNDNDNEDNKDESNNYDDSKWQQITAMMTMTANNSNDDYDTKW